MARYGGEEFVVLLPGADAAITARIAEDYRRVIAHLELDYDGVQANVTCSIGATTRRSDHRYPRESLLKQADQALYKAKHSGRNQYFTENVNFDAISEAG